MEKNQSQSLPASEFFVTNETAEEYTAARYSKQDVRSSPANSEEQQNLFRADELETTAHYSAVVAHQLSSVESTPCDALSTESLPLPEDLMDGASTSSNIEFDVHVESIWVTMNNGEQLHMRYLMPIPTEAILTDTESLLDEDAGICAEMGLASRQRSTPSKPSTLGIHSNSNEPSGELKHRRVFMLHGEVECGRIFFHPSGKGLAHYLARQGYEVFVADLGGRGRSLVADGKQSTLTVSSVIKEAIPKLLTAAGRFQSSQYSNFIGGEPTQPDIWIGRGFGAVMLSGAWARMSEKHRSATQMIFLNARRQVESSHPVARWFVKLFCHSMTEKWVNWQRVFPATRLGLGSADESASWYKVYSSWMSGASWIDPVDLFDYRAALAEAGMPPIMHIAAAADKVYANPLDVRAFMEELGPHDGRLLILDRMGSTASRAWRSAKRYGHLNMLLDEQAEVDVFRQAADWLNEPTAQQQGVNREVNQNRHDRVGRAKEYFGNEELVLDTSAAAKVAPADQTLMRYAS